MIVTFHPSDDTAPRAEQITRLVGGLIVVDNCSLPSELQELRQLSVLPKVWLIENDANLGIATALNQGVEMAMSLGYSWALLLDQDTEPCDQMLNELAAAYEDYPHKEKIAVLGSNYFVASTGAPRYVSVAHHVAPWVEQKTVITAGSLLSLALFSVIGRFRDEFFIDHVDHEFCLRARAKGFRIIMTLAPVMRHSVGAATSHGLLWKRTGTSNHAPIRRYYMVRNHIALAREYVWVEPVWVATTLYNLLKTLVLVATFEKQRFTKLSMVAKGLYDGALGHFGK